MRHSPDLLLCEHAPVALAAAYLNDVPVYRIGNGFIVPSNAGFETLRPWAPCETDELMRLHQVADAALIELAIRYGKSKSIGLQRLYAASPAILATWPEIDHADDRGDALYHGPLTSDASDELLGDEQAEIPRAFVYMPTTFGKAALIYQALATLGWKTVWFGGRGCREGRVGEITVSAQPQPVTSIIGENTVVIYRAGCGLSCDVLRLAARPVLVPDTVESSLLAYRLEKRGLGNVLPATQNADLICDGLRHIATVTFNASRRGEVAQKYQSYNGLAVCDEFAAKITNLY